MQGGKKRPGPVASCYIGLTKFHSAQRCDGLGTNVRDGEAQESESKFLEQPNYNLWFRLLNLVVEATVLIPHNLIVKNLSVMMLQNNSTLERREIMTLYKDL
jgi:hypothetical protein